jgi:hypothetical protein
MLLVELKVWRTQSRVEDSPWCVVFNIFPWRIDCMTQDVLENLVDENKAANTVPRKLHFILWPFGFI